MRPALCWSHDSDVHADSGCLQTLPASWGQGEMPALYTLDVSGNQLSGTLPAWGQDGGMARWDQLSLLAQARADSC